MIPIKKVIPDYPEHLKQEGIRGEIAIGAMIDMEGKVRTAFVIRKLHPELDALALKAAKQWRFKPFIYKGKPVTAPTYITMVFGAEETGHAQADVAETQKLPVSERMAFILDRCASYCSELAAYALFYVCQEKIDEQIKTVEKRKSSANYHYLNLGIVISAHYMYPALGKNIEAERRYDYQLINQDGRIVERRISLMKKEQTAGNAPTEIAIRQFSPKPVLIPIMLMSKEQQIHFNYELKKEQRIKGKDAYGIEVIPRRKNWRGISQAYVWVDKGTFQILKTQIDSTYLEGYDGIQEECDKNHLTPHFTVITHFGVSKNALLFPSQTDIAVEYSGLMLPETGTKAIVKINYENYRFFSVDVKHGIIKKFMDAILRNPCNWNIFTPLHRIYPIIIRH